MYNDNYKPLVSVVVITYHSAAYVSETLESIKQQTYKSIELIITDDGSKDDTVLICESWLNNNEDAFVAVKLIKSDINTGTSANCNRGVKAANGEWIKIIAGDDALYPNAIQQYIDFINQQNNPEIKIIQTNMDVFANNFSSENFIKTDDLSRLYQTKNEATAIQQFEIMIRDPHLNSPSLFIKRSVYSEAGLYNEKYTLMEDFPWLLNALRVGIKIYFINFSSVKYRKTVNSVQISKAKNAFVSNFKLQHDEFIYREICRHYTKTERFFFIRTYKARKLLVVNGLNIKSLKNRIIFVLLLSFPLCIFRLVLKYNLKKIIA